MTAPLSEDALNAITVRLEKASLRPCTIFGAGTSQLPELAGLLSVLLAHACKDITALLAEIARLKAELAKYSSFTITI